MHPTFYNEMVYRESGFIGGTVFKGLTCLYHRPYGIQLLQDLPIFQFS
jgi:hypothetical protein